MTILVNPFRAGSGIDINYNTGTIANSGVLSVDSNTGNLTLSAGTGISISGLTITNTGVDSLVAGTGISLSATTGSVTVTNSGVTSFQGDTGSISLSAGTGISISGLTISNAGVTSLQSETGALSLTAGTGISISGLTITNTGITSLTAGNGISVSGSTGGVTITNTGITSLTAGNGISVSGSTISMSGSYSGDFTVSGQGNFGDALGLTTSEIGFFPYSSGTVLGEDMSFLTLWGTVDNVGVWMGENYTSLQIGLFNRTSSTQGALSGNSWMMNLGINQNGEVYTFVPTNYAIGDANSVNSSIRNTLDNGSGDMSIAGYATGGFAQFFNSGTIRVSVQALSYSITLPAGTWAGFITVGIFFVPLSNTYSYQIGVNLSGSAFVSGSTYGYSTLTNIAGGSGSNYPLDNFPPIPLEIESSGGTITFDVVNSDATDGMTSIFSGNSDNAFVITVFLVSTGTAS